jgi:membrane peptidoglycan carboxypeptidase
VSATVAYQLTRMLQGVVEEGTGRAAALGTYQVAGKTGTARRVIGGRYLPGHYWASFVGIFPAQDPQLVLVVKLDDPQGAYFAGSTAAPVVRTILEAALATPGVALDRGRLVRHRLADTSGAPAAAEVAPGTSVVVPWPMPPEGADTAAPVPVPDVAGSDLRAAARALHRSGFQVRVEGWGRVTVTTPAAGTPVRPGRVVVVRAEADRAG